jgi:hypothetical protein
VGTSYVTSQHARTLVDAVIYWRGAAESTNRRDMTESRSRLTLIGCVPICQIVLLHLWNDRRTIE